MEKKLELFKPDIKSASLVDTDFFDTTEINCIAEKYLHQITFDIADEYNPFFIVNCIEASLQIEVNVLNKKKACFYEIYDHIQERADDNIKT
jgi:hypothetical protein